MTEIDLDALLNAKESSSWKKRVAGNFWATDSGKCKRQVYYSFTNPKEFDKSTLRTFRIGTILHDHIQSVLKELEGTTFSEVWNEKYNMLTDNETDLVITGRIDTVLVPKDGGKPTLLEFKTESEKAFAMRKSVPLHHKTQLTCYMRGQRVDHAYVVYINKTNFQLNPMRVDYSQDLMNSIMKSIRDIYWHLTNSKLPPANPIMKWQCTYCKWKDDCDKNHNSALRERLKIGGNDK